MTAPRIAVLLPCYNEAVAIAGVVRDFRAALPDARIYVYDNNSRDNTAAVARDAGASVRRETRQGKGHVVRRMFADIDADIYVLADGDGTYDAACAPQLVARLVDEQLDMVVGIRIETAQAAYRPGHRFGNLWLTTLVCRIFGREVRDILSGYRVFSRRFVKSFPALATGFETETEITVHALDLGLPVGEVETPYYARPEGSTSKLNTFRDGLRILRLIGYLAREERPLAFFSLIAATLALAGLVLGTPVVVEFFHTGLVPRLPTAVLATGFVLLAFLALVCGLVMETVTHGRREAKRLAYLRLPPVG